MKKQPSIRINIPTPCNEGWNNMTPNERGRYCGSCQKTVVDFTNYTDEELLLFFTEHKGQKLCGHFNKYQLNREINLPHQPHSTLYKWIVAAGLAMMIVAAPVGNSFAKAPYSITAPINADITDEQDTTGNGKVNITGIVRSINELPIAQAKVIILYKGVSLGSTHTNKEGKFTINNLTAKDYTINITHPDYEYRTIPLNKEQINTQHIIDVVLYSNNMNILGDIAIDGEPAIINVPDTTTATQHIRGKIKCVEKK